MVAIGRQNGRMPGISVALLRRQGTPLQSCSAWWMGVTPSEGLLESACDGSQVLRGAADDEDSRR
jgi:hypothetical protein